MTNNRFAEHQQYSCIVLLADGKHISQYEICKTAKEAIERAEKWRAVGHNAYAQMIVCDLKTKDIYSFRLD